MNYGQIKKILKVASADAVVVYNGVGEPNELAPNTYEGDGEAFSFSLANGELGEVPAEDIALAKEIYLAGFWNTIEEMQEDDELTTTFNALEKIRS